MAALERGPSLTEQAADALRERIVCGFLRLGEPLSELALAADSWSARRRFAKP